MRNMLQAWLVYDQQGVIAPEERQEIIKATESALQSTAGKALLEEVETNRARLDWLEGKAQDYAVSFTYFSSGRIDLVVKNPDTGTLLACHSQESLRQATDAAMGQAGKGEK